MRQNVYLFVFIVPVIFALSCGDILNKKKRISGNYYLVENEFRGGMSVYFRSSEGDFVERIPAKVVEYGFNKKYIVAKCNVNDSIMVFMINRDKDFHYAEPFEYLLGPFDLSQYDSMSRGKSIQIIFDKI
jgi:hypothetical protein